MVRNLRLTTKTTSRIGVVIAFVFILSINPGDLYAQENVGIGTNSPDASAVLHLDIDLLSSPKGFLAPRMTNAERGNISSPATGLIIFQTDDQPGEPSGFYYYDGTDWLRISDGSVSGDYWSLTGNASTTPATDYIGTSDDVDLIIKTDAAQRMKFNSTTNGGDVEINENLSLTNSGTVKEFRILEQSGNGTNFTGFKAPDALAGDVMYTLPDDFGSNGEFLMTDATGSLSWNIPSVSIPGGAEGYTIHYSGGSWVANSFLYNTGSQIGINTTSPNLARMHLVDDVSSENRAAFRVQQQPLGGPGYVYGIHSTIAGTAPSQVAGYFSSTGSANNYALIADNGFVGVGIINPDKKMHLRVNENTKVQFKLEQEHASGDVGQLFNLESGSINFTVGVDNDDNDNFEISNSDELTGTTYSDANTMMRIHSETNSEGIVDFPNQSRARAYRNTSTFSLTSGSAIPIEYNAESFDSKNEFNTTNYTFTAKETGYYQVNARFEFDPPADPNNQSYCYATIYVGVTEYARGAYFSLEDSDSDRAFGTAAATVSDIIYVEAGQTVQIYGYQNSGASVDVNFSDHLTYFSIHKLS